MLTARYGLPVAEIATDSGSSTARARRRSLAITASVARSSWLSRVDCSVWRLAWMIATTSATTAADTINPSTIATISSTRLKPAWRFRPRWTGMTVIAGAWLSTARLPTSSGSPPACTSAPVPAS